MGHLLQGKLTASFIGVALRAGIQVRPGKLGCFARLFRFCALKTFRRQQPEVLPLPLPPMQDEDKKLDEILQDWIQKGSQPTEAELDKLKEAASAHGAGVLLRQWRSDAE